MERLDLDLFQDPEVEERETQVSGTHPCCYTIPLGTLTFPGFDTDFSP